MGLMCLAWAPLDILYGRLFRELAGWAASRRTSVRDADTGMQLHYWINLLVSSDNRASNISFCNAQ